MNTNAQQALAHIQLVLALNKNSLWPEDIKTLEAACRVLSGVK